MIVKHYKHPFMGGFPHVCETANIGEWLLETFGQNPSVTVQVFEGEPSAETEITRDIPALVRSDAEYYTVLESPGGAMPAIWMVMSALAAATALVAVAAIALTNTPSYNGGLPNRTSKSPNNELADRSNKVRILERIEDIYGTVRSIPSLIAPTYTKYINNIQYEYAYFCVGRGYYAIDDIRDGETLLSDIDGARAAVFDPFTSPNSGDSPIMSIGGSIEDGVITVKRSNEVDGITLRALNQVQLQDSQPYDFVPAATAGTAGDFLRQNDAQPTFESIAAPGDTITITMPEFTGTVTASSTDNSFNTADTFTSLGLSNGDQVTVSGFADPANHGTFTVSTVSPHKLEVSATLVDETASATMANTDRSQFNGVYEIASINGNTCVLTTATWTTEYNDLTATIKLDGQIAEWSDWVTLAEVDRNQVWANVVAINGMYKDGGDGKIVTTVAFEFEIERLDSDLNPTGNVEVVTDSLSGGSADVKATTVETVTSFTGPCRFRCRRTTPADYDFAGVVVDEIKLADLYSVSPIDKNDFGNITTVQTVTKATLRALAAKERQLNCLASRLLPIYDGSGFSGSFDSTGRLVSGSISATSRFIDIMAAISLDPAIGNRSLSTDVDISQIYSVYQQVAAWGSEYAEFNHTFDDDNLSYEETVRMIANAVFCVPYRQNGKIRFAFDTAQTNPVVPTFCHRNKKPDSETITRNFAADANYDGVELVYMDPETERNETIKLPLDGSATKYKKVEVPGIRNFAQAWMRASREYERLKNQRVVIETTATTDARALLPNSRIDIVDDTRFKRFGGEVLAVDGLTLTLSQPVEFAPGEPHSILLKRRNGDSEGITVTPGPTAYKVVLQSLPQETIVTTPGEDGIRTIYSFASDSQREKQAWLVQEIIPQDKQYVQVRAINYSVAYYQHDYLPIPDKNTVIYS